MEVSFLYITHAVMIPARPISTDGIAIMSSISDSNTLPSEVTSLLKGMNPVTIEPMARIKRGIMHAKRRRNLLAKTKGFMWGRKSKIKLARTAVLKSGVASFKGRKQKKRDFRSLWTVRINAACRERGMSYSKFIDAIHKANIELDRKVLANIALEHPQVFDKIFAEIKK